VRYSEDIDLDVVVIAKATSKNKVDRLLQSAAVLTPLAAKGVRVVETSAPKQTDTTQRWKAGLRVDGSDVPLRTKIEFSRRDAIEGAAFEATTWPSSTRPRSHERADALGAKDPVGAQPHAREGAPRGLPRGRAHATLRRARGALRSARARR
jgi:hypothetical protein